MGKIVTKGDTKINSTFFHTFIFSPPPLQHPPSTPMGRSFVSIWSLDKNVLERKTSEKRNGATTAAAVAPRREKN